MRQLRPYQEEAVAYAARVNNPALYLDMRLGKTLTLIRAVQARNDIRTVLVIAPLSVLEVWKDELDAEGFDATLLRPGTRFRNGGSSGFLLPAVAGARSPLCWFVTNYEYVLANKDLARAPWDAVVLDESTRIRNPRTKTTKLVLRNFRQAKMRAVLSGYPAPQSPLDYVTQLIFLNGKCLGYDSYWKFRQYYCYLAGFDWLLTPRGRERLAKEVSAKCFTLSRKDAELDNQKIYERRYVDMSPEQARQHRKALEDWETDYEQTAWSVVVSGWLARIAGGFAPDGSQLTTDAKLRELECVLRGDLAGDQVVCLCRYRAELRAIWSLLKDLAIPAVWVEGGVPRPERVRRLAKFRDGKARVMVAQVQTVRFGLDFSNADAMVFYSNTFSIEDRKQTEERLTRVGKRSPNLYIDLVTRGSIDEDLVEALRDKSLSEAAFRKRVMEETRRRLACT